jgi:hypothetical protein
VFGFGYECGFEVFLVMDLNVNKTGLSMFEAIEVLDLWKQKKNKHESKTRSGFHISTFTFSIKIAVISNQICLVFKATQQSIGYRYD